jgi:hypothetical protein
MASIARSRAILEGIEDLGGALASPFVAMATTPLGKNTIREMRREAPEEPFLAGPRSPVDTDPFAANVADEIVVTAQRLTPEEKAARTIERAGEFGERVWRDPTTQAVATAPIRAGQWAAKAPFDPMGALGEAGGFMFRDAPRALAESPVGQFAKAIYVYPVTGAIAAERRALEAVDAGELDGAVDAYKDAHINELLTLGNAAFGAGDAVFLANLGRGARGAKAGPLADEAFAPAAPLRAPEAPGTVAEELMRLPPQKAGEPPELTAYRNALIEERNAEIAAENAAKAGQRTAGFGHANTLAQRRALEEATARNGGAFSPAPRYGENALSEPVPVTPARVDPVNRMRFSASDPPDRGALFPQAPQGALSDPFEPIGNARGGAPQAGVGASAANDRGLVGAVRGALAEDAAALRNRPRNLRAASTVETVRARNMGVVPGDDGVYARGYHGSPNEFNRLDEGRIGTGNSRGEGGYGFYFFDDADLAASRGHVYAADLPDGPYIDFDAPVSEQPEAVKAALRALGINVERAPPPGLSIRRSPDGSVDLQMPGEDGWRTFRSEAAARGYAARASGADVYHELARKLGGQRAASEALADAGIAGVRSPGRAGGTVTNVFPRNGEGPRLLSRDGRPLPGNQQRLAPDEPEGVFAPARGRQGEQSNGIGNETNRTSTERLINPWREEKAPHGTTAGALADYSDGLSWAEVARRNGHSGADSAKQNVNLLLRRARLRIADGHSIEKVAAENGTDAKTLQRALDAGPRPPRVKSDANKELLERIVPLWNRSSVGADGVEVPALSLRQIAEELNLPFGKVAGVISRSDDTRLRPRIPGSLRGWKPGSGGIDPWSNNARAARSVNTKKPDAANIFAPLGYGSLGGALALGAGDAEAQEGDEIEALKQRIAELEEDERLVNNLNDPASVRKVQRRINVNDDGVIGVETRQAIDAYRERVRGDLGEARARLQAFEEAEAEQSTRATPFQQAAREFGPYAGLGAGLLLGHLTRGGAVRGADRALAARNARADALLTEAPLRGGPKAAAKRVGNLNDFWWRGGAGNRVPFEAAKTPRGFKPRKDAAAASELFQPQATLLRIPDYGFMGLGALDATIATGFLNEAKREQEAAREAVRLDPSVANRVRLEQANDAVALWTSAQRFGIGMATGRGGSAFTHRYSNARPNVALADRERILLNQYLTAKRKPKPKPKKATD